MKDELMKFMILKHVLLPALCVILLEKINIGEKEEDIIEEF